MAGTPEGARKALETKRKKYGEDVMKKWGKQGGEARNESPNRYSPFEGNSEFASAIGTIGGYARWSKDPLSAIARKEREQKKAERLARKTQKAQE